MTGWTVRAVRELRRHTQLPTSCCKGAAPITMHVLLQLQVRYNVVGEPVEASSADHQLMERCAVHCILRSKHALHWCSLRSATGQSKNPGGLPAALHVLGSCAAPATADVLANLAVGGGCRVHAGTHAARRLADKLVRLS